MVRIMSKEKKIEYEELKMFFVIWETHVSTQKIFELSHPYHPINVLAAMESKHGVSFALGGLKQAINDNLEICEDFCLRLLSELTLF